MINVIPRVRTMMNKVWLGLEVWVLVDRRILLLLLLHQNFLNQGGTFPDGILK